MSIQVWDSRRLKGTGIVSGRKLCLLGLWSTQAFHHSLGQATWPQPQRDSAHQCGAAGGLGRATLTPREKKLCNHQELLLWQVHLRTGTFSILWVRQVPHPPPIWAGSKAVTLVPPGSPALAMRAKQWLFKIFTLKTMPTVCLLVGGAEAGWAGSWMLPLCLLPLIFLWYLYIVSFSYWAHTVRGKISLLLCSSFIIANILLRLKTLVFSAH